mmetsp:Transcript_67970/g.112991  ORF Transcript_67970/g.112991 Transcript_67970/m.112991 type:complete len:131 (-) Transcript_67970:727-1119(-)
MYSVTSRAQKAGSLMPGRRSITSAQAEEVENVISRYTRPEQGADPAWDGSPNTKRSFYHHQLRWFSTCHDDAEQLFEEGTAPLTVIRQLPPQLAWPLPCTTAQPPFSAWKTHLPSSSTRPQKALPSQPTR